MQLSRLNKWFLPIAIIAVIGSIAWGFSKLGSPVSQRKVAADARRLEDLHNIASIIYRGTHPQPYIGTAVATSTLDRVLLPDTLPGVIAAFSPNDPSVQILDPITKNSYEYYKMDGNHYRICASFETDSAKVREKMQSDNYRGADSKAWDHPTGNYCFTIDSSKDVPYYYGDIYRSPSFL